MFFLFWDNFKSVLYATAVCTVNKWAAPRKRKLIFSHCYTILAGTKHEKAPFLCSFHHASPGSSACL